MEREPMRPEGTDPEGEDETSDATVAQPLSEGRVRRDSDRAAALAGGGVAGLVVGAVVGGIPGALVGALMGSVAGKAVTTGSR